MKRELIVRAEKIAALSHARRCDDIQQLAASVRLTNLPAGGAASQRVPVCSFAPEWAEHARFGRGDEPCGDGRAGGV